MTAIVLNLAIEQGATFRKHMMLASIRDGAAVGADGVPLDLADLIPIDLTGCTAHMQARTVGSPVVPVLDLSTDTGGITLGDATGTIDLYVSADVTAAMVSRAMAYDMLILYGNGDVLRTISGSVTVSPGVTRGV